MNDCEIKTADQHCYKFLLIQQILTQCKLIINNVEIIAIKLQLFKNQIIYFINQEISAERERSIGIIVSFVFCGIITVYGVQRDSQGTAFKWSVICKGFLDGC